MRIRNIKSKLKTVLLSALMLAAVVVPQVVQPLWLANVMAAERELPIYYFRDQLEGNELKFYEAMVRMEAAGYFRVGTQSYEVTGLTGLGSIDNDTLLKQMGAGRDAFMLDYPDLFYVDFDAFSMTVSGSGASRRVSLGAGRRENYINQEFLNNDGKLNETKLNNAINSVNSAINSIVAEAEGKSTIEKVGLAHDKVAETTDYTLEYQTDFPYTIRTVYGVFGVRNAVCEGYARAVKAVLDRLNVQSILVHGFYQDASGPQEHMWVYAQLDDGKWYGVDATFDDKDYGNGVALDKYRVVEEDVMSKHIPAGIISSSEKEFSFPILAGSQYDSLVESWKGYDGNVIYDVDGIKVEYAGDETVKSTDVHPVFHISYNGDGYKRAAEKGNYIVINGWQIAANHENGAETKYDYLPTGWLYPIDVEGGDAYPYEDHGDYVSVGLASYYGFQVGVSKVGPTEIPGPGDGGFDAWDYTFKGVDYEEGKNTTKTDIFVRSEALDVIGGEIREYPQPFVKKTTPAHTVKQRVGKTYHITVTYDQAMRYKTAEELREGEELGKLGYEVLLYDRVYGYRKADEGTMKFEIKNLSMSVNDQDGNLGTTTFTYDFTPSKLWSLDDTAYIVKFTGVVGKASEKEPNTVSYVVANGKITCIYQLMAMDIDMQVYGKPTLMDGFDLSDVVDADSIAGIEDWDKLEEALQSYGDLLKHRLTLMTTKPSEKEEEKLRGQLDGFLGEQEYALDNTSGKVSVEMYNISLSLCTCELQKLKNGTKLQLRLGFPEGYGPDDAGVTFAAYHYQWNETSKSYEIEQIPCTITEYGLVIDVRSFSPFAIVALDAKVNADKIKNDPKIIGEEDTILFTSETGGKIFNNAGDVVFGSYEQGGTFTIKADEGYTIAGLTIDGNEVEAAKGETEYKFEADKGQKVVVTFTNIAKTTTAPGTPSTPTEPTGKVIKFNVGNGGKVLDKGDKEVSGELTVPDDEEYLFTAKANSGFRVKRLLLDGEAVEEAIGKTEYSFKAKAGMTVDVEFGEYEGDDDEDFDSDKWVDKDDDDDNSGSNSGSNSGKPGTSGTPNTGASTSGPMSTESEVLYAAAVAVAALAGAIVFAKQRKNGNRRAPIMLFPEV